MSTLTEELFLLADDAVTGRPLIDHTHLDLGLGGAMLLDLVLRSRLALIDFHVHAMDVTATGDLLVDTALTEIAGEARTHDPDYWVRRLARDASHKVRDQLVASGVLRLDDHKVLGLIPVHQRPQVDTSVGHGLTTHLHDAVVLGHPASPRTAALASLVLAVGLERHLFPRCDQRSIRSRISELTAGQWVAEAVAHTINATNAALGIVPFDALTGTE